MAVQVIVRLLDPRQKTRRISVYIEERYKEEESFMSKRPAAVAGYFYEANADRLKSFNDK